MRKPDGRFERFTHCVELHFLDGRVVRGWFRSREEVDRRAPESEREHQGSLAAVLVFELLSIGGIAAEEALPEAIRVDETRVEVSPLPYADIGDDDTEFDPNREVM